MSFQMKIESVWTIYVQWTIIESHLTSLHCSCCESLEW